MTATHPKPSLTREYWTHNVGEPTGPVAQFRMSQLIDYDLRLTDPARIVYRFLIGWYMRSNGDALASVRHIVTTMRTRAPDGARHLSRSAVQRAIILLIETGWLVRRFTGKGRSGSRYVPVLNVLELAAQGSLPSVEIDSVPLYRDTNEESVASHSTGTEVSHSTGTLSAVASHLPGQRPSYINPSTDRVTCKEDNECAAAMPPPVSGLSPATAGPAQGKEKTPFEELYREYGVRAEVGAARRAYDELAPDAELHAAMVDSARAWREAAGGSIERMHLRRWIAEQRYLEDPKGERKTKERKPKPAKPAKDVEAAKPVPAKPVAKPADPFRPMRQVFTILEANEVTVDEDKWLDLVLVDEDGKGEDISICVEAPDEDRQCKGQRNLDRILSATGLISCDDASKLVGEKFVRALYSKFGEFEYERVPENNAGFVVVDEPRPTASAPRNRVRFVPRFSIVPKAQTATREKAKEWAAKFNDDEMGEAA